MNTWSREVRSVFDKKINSLSSCLQTLNQLDVLDVQWDTTGTIHILQNHTVDQLINFVKLSGFRRGIELKVSLSDYDNYQQDIINKKSYLYTHNIDLVVLSLLLDNINLVFDKNGELCISKLESHLINLVEQIKNNFQGYIAINTFIPPMHQPHYWHGQKELKELNQQIRELARKDNRVVCIDFESILTEVGNEHGIDLRYWFMFKAPYRSEFLVLWAEELAQIIASLKGRARKALILDCDNTLWGGIVGEDGLEGIKLDPYEYPGNVFYAFQQQIIDLGRTGVLLAICSKNNENDVLEVLRRHSHCLLKEHHLAAWKINWMNKTENLQALAKILNISLDTFTFIDDNVTECEMVRQFFPMVDVLQVPTELYKFPELLKNYNHFKNIAITAEDTKRNKMIIEERNRNKTRELFCDIESFLASLELKVDISIPTDNELERFAQLTQKTNQFNLTTRRYNFKQIEELSKSDHSLLLRMKVWDKYGDYGITGISIAYEEKDAILIDTFLMSCRIIGKNLEDVFISELIRWIIQKWGQRKIKADYIATSKNQQVKNFYDAHGFSCIKEDTNHRAYVRNSDTQLPEYPPYILIMKDEREIDGQNR